MQIVPGYLDNIREITNLFMQIFLLINENVFFLLLQGVIPFLQFMHPPNGTAVWASSEENGILRVQVSVTILAIFASSEPVLHFPHPPRSTASSELYGNQDFAGITHAAKTLLNIYELR